MFNFFVFKSGSLDPGAITLLSLLLIGSLIAEIGVVGAFVSYFLGQSGFGIKVSEEALAAAYAGVQDALIRIIRDKNFNPNPNPYILIIDNSSAQITICKDICAGANTFQIDSLGASFNKRRQVRTIIQVSPVSGEINMESQEEIVIE
ncbi:hypothetical protein JW698_00745 [Candidatus Wolfebacteria bacterium]|nr:hypothetical protein [Candidatus Wolfebacteria bacterium]